jgi:hypothetical protein
MPDPRTPEGLRAALALLGWSQTQLARECDEPLRTVQGWLAGRRKKGVPGAVAKLITRQLMSDPPPA